MTKAMNYALDRNCAEARRGGSRVWPIARQGETTKKEANRCSL